MSNSLYIVIVGCGRLGSYLSNQLSHVGHSVVVIDIENWKGFGILLLILLMLIGGGTCSTAGGIKQFRIIYYGSKSPPCSWGD